MTFQVIFGFSLVMMITWKMRTILCHLLNAVANRISKIHIFCKIQISIHDVKMKTVEWFFVSFSFLSSAITFYSWKNMNAEFLEGKHSATLKWFSISEGKFLKRGVENTTNNSDSRNDAHNVIHFVSKYQNPAEGQLSSHTIIIKFWMF